MDARNDLLLKIREDFYLEGQSVAGWARANNFRQDLVYAVLTGRTKGLRGESHLIAMKLGLKSRRPTETQETDKNQ